MFRYGWNARNLFSWAFIYHSLYSYSVSFIHWCQVTAFTNYLFSTAWRLNGYFSGSVTTHSELCCFQQPWISTNRLHKSHNAPLCNRDVHTCGQGRGGWWYNIEKDILSSSGLAMIRTQEGVSPHPAISPLWVYSNANKQDTSIYDLVCVSVHITTPHQRCGDVIKFTKQFILQICCCWHTTHEFIESKNVQEAH